MKRKLLQSRILFFIAALFLFYPRAVPAGTYDGSESLVNSNTVDIKATLALMRNLEKDNTAAAKNRMRSLARGTLFWKGTVTHFIDYPQNYWMRLRSENGDFFWVFAQKNIRNLDFDRTGYRVGVKGSPVLNEESHFLYLQARSVILLSPPQESAYHRFRQKFKLSDEIIIKADNKTYRMKSPHYPFILHRIYTHNPHYSWETIQKIAGGIVYYCRVYQVDPLLMTALFNVESAFDLDAVSSTGAMGLGQLMPSTARGLGVNPNDPVQNIKGSVRYFSGQLRRWAGNEKSVPLALASYNAGPGAVSRYGGVPPYSETRNYVFFITMIREEYEKQLNDTESEETSAQ